MSNKGYEMIDNSPEGPKKSYKAIAIAIVILVIAGGTAYAMTRDSGKTAPTVTNKPPEQTQATSETTKPSTPPNQTSAVTTQTNQETKVTTNLAPANQIVHFGVDSAVLLPGEEAKVQEFITKVKEGRGDILIDGYTDNLGTHAHGVTLSEQRAKTVDDILKQLNLGNQLTTAIKGNAEANPVGDNSTLQGRAQNRRVEMKFVPKN